MGSLCMANGPMFLNPLLHSKKAKSFLTPLKYHVFENMENGAFALSVQMLHFQ